MNPYLNNKTWDNLLKSNGMEYSYDPRELAGWVNYRKGSFLVGYCLWDIKNKRFPRIRVQYKSFSCIVTRPATEDVFLLLQAIQDPVMLPACLCIPWALPLVEKALNG